MCVCVYNYNNHNFTLRWHTVSAKLCRWKVWQPLMNGAFTELWHVKLHQLIVAFIGNTMKWKGQWEKFLTNWSPVITLFCHQKSVSLYIIMHVTAIPYIEKFWGKIILLFLRISLKPQKFNYTNIFQWKLQLMIIIILQPITLAKHPLRGMFSYISSTSMCRFTQYRILLCNSYSYLTAYS